MDYRKYKNCDEENASAILTEHAEGIFWYFQKNKDVYEDFCEAEIENDISMAEYIWLTHWEDFLDFLTDFLN